MGKGLGFCSFSWGHRDPSADETICKQRPEQTNYRHVIIASVAGWGGVQALPVTFTTAWGVLTALAF